MGGGLPEPDAAVKNGVDARKKNIVDFISGIPSRIEDKKPR